MEEPKKEEKLLEERKQKVLSFIKVKYAWISYVALAIVVWFAVWLRSLPMKINPSTGHPGLWDITTNNWTLGPDLDPFLFLRWAKYIVANGHLMLNDSMRYLPVGFNTSQEYILMPYMIAWFHNFLSFFHLTSSVEYSAVVYPLFMFALGLIAIFLFVRKVFLEKLGVKWANLTAVLSVFFISIIPGLVPRVIAGIPDKQGTSLFFMFMAPYLFLCAWKAEKLRNKIILALGAGIFTGLFGIYWGGNLLAFMIINLAVLIYFISGNVERNNLYVYGLWILSALLIMHETVTLFTIGNLLSSFSTGSSVAILVVLLFDQFVYKKFIKHKIKTETAKKFPHSIISLIISVLLVIVLALITLGPGPFLHIVQQSIAQFLNPAPTDRFNVTVAENRSPFFSEILGSFGPMLGNIPLFAAFFLVGSIFMVWKLFEHIEKKDRIYITTAYAIFLFCTIFSKYSSTGLLNGDNFLSYLLYGAGILIFAGTAIYYFLKYHKSDRAQLFGKLDLGFLILITFLVFTLLTSRGLVRIILLLIPPAAIVGSYFITAVAMYVAKVFKEKQDNRKIFAWFLGILVLVAAIYSAYSLYSDAKATAESYVPSAYTQQWQLAMSWVRTNTPTNAVFAHWWDYGYWVQTMGFRATVLDGGNAISYWDHMMGRYALTDPNDTEALQFLYTHNATNLLIDSSDIGKYSAFSSIGSDINYDRASYIPTYTMDPQQTQENKNSTLYLYQGGAPVDQDIFYTINGTQVFLPAGKAALGGVVIVRDNNSSKIISPPKGIFVYQNIQYAVPFRYAFSEGNLIDFGEGSGLDAGVFIFPGVVQTSSGVAIQKDYAMLYLSERTVGSQVARFYLFNENSSYFKLVHSQDDFVVSSLKNQNAISQNDDFVYYQGLRGPIKIWQINYPAGIKADPTYLNMTWPDNLRHV